MLPPDRDHFDDQHSPEKSVSPGSRIAPGQKPRREAGLSQAITKEKRQPKPNVEEGAQPQPLKTGGFNPAVWLKTHPSLAWLGLFVVIALLLAVGGYWYYVNDTQAVRRERYNELKAIADLKTSQIIAWRAERLSDARLQVNDPLFQNTLQQWLTNPLDAALKKGIFERLQNLANAYGYQNIILADPQGDLLLSLDPQLSGLEADAQALVSQVISAGEAVFGDFSHDCPVCQQIHLDVGAPVMSLDGKAIAVLILRTDPNQYLYPLIQSWPLPSPSGETLLVRRDGENVLFLNQLRHRSDPPLSLRNPISQESLPAVQAALGQTGEFVGLDYRGVEVLADMRPIPGSDWFMIAKIDLSEVEKESQYHGWIILIVTGLSIILSGALVGMIFNRRQRQLYQSLFVSERERRQAREEIRLTLYSIGDGVIATDAEGLVTRMNPVAEQLTGWNEAEAVGKRLNQVFQIYSEDTQAKVDNPVERIIREGKVVGLANHTLLRARDGTLRPIADSGAPIHDLEGGIRGVVLVFRDQSKERAAQKTLSESEARYKSLFESTNDGIALHEIVYNEASTAVNYRILDVNQMYEQILGIPKTTAIGALATQLYGTQEPPYLEVYARVAETGEPTSFETYFSPMDMHFHISVFSTAPGIFATVFQNVTERKKAEETLRNYSANLEKEVQIRTHELQEAQERLIRQERLAVLGQLAGSIGHELRNPLGVISNAVYYLKAVQTDASPHVKEYLDIIAAETHTAERIISDLLNFTRLKPGERSAVSIEQLVAQALQTNLIPETVAVSTELPPDLPPVLVDALQISQVLNNLIVNACQAMPEGGKLNLKASLKGKWLHLSVCDTGGGIPPENIEKIFEPLFTTKARGIGLGLAVSKKLVEANDGRLEVQSRLGEGSCFNLIFPLTIQKEPV